MNTSGESAPQKALAHWRIPLDQIPEAYRNVNHAHIGQQRQAELWWQFCNVLHVTRQQASAKGWYKIQMLLLGRWQNWVTQAPTLLTTPLELAPEEELAGATLQQALYEWRADTMDRLRAMASLSQNRADNGMAYRLLGDVQTYNACTQHAADHMGLPMHQPPKPARSTAPAPAAPKPAPWDDEFEDDEEEVW